MSGRYKNAAEALPPDLLAEVQKHHVGLLWVPKHDCYHKERRQLVERLLRCGVGAAEVARLAGLTRRRVQQTRGDVDPRSVSEDTAPPER